MKKRKAKVISFTLIALITMATIGVVAISAPGAENENVNDVVVVTDAIQENPTTDTEAVTEPVDDEPMDEEETEVGEIATEEILVKNLAANDETDAVPSENIEDATVPATTVSTEPAENADPIVRTAQYKAYVPDGYQKVIVVCGPLGLADAAEAMGETRFAIIEVVNFVQSFTDIAQYEDEILGYHCQTILAGIASGAEGVWNLAADNNISAIVPISGTPTHAISDRLSYIPVLALMRSTDHITVRAAMQDTVRELQDRGNTAASYLVDSNIFGAQLFDWCWING